MIVVAVVWLISRLIKFLSLHRTKYTEENLSYIVYVQSVHKGHDHSCWIIFWLLLAY